MAVETLLRAGANPETGNKDGVTPLHWAAVSGQPSMIKALLNGGAKVNAKANHEVTPLAMAKYRMNSVEGSIQPFKEVIDLLKAHGGR